MDKRLIKSGGKEHLPQAVSLLSKVFETDPVIIYMLSSMSPQRRLSYFPTYFNALLTAAALNGASFEEIDDWKCCAVLIPPGQRVDNPRTWLQSGLLSLLWNIKLSGCNRMLAEFTPKSDKAKVKGLKGKKQKYYYVFFVGTRIDSRNQGLSSAILKNYQSKAARDNLPVWLEATTPYSRDLYGKLGFETVEEIVLGKGKAAADGTKFAGGEGVKLWSMVWWPPSLSRS